MLGLSLSSLKLNEFMPSVWHCLHILRQVVLEMHNDTNHSPNTMPSIVPVLLHSASFSPWKKAVSLLSPLKLFQDTITSQRNQPFLPFEFSPYSRPPNSELNTPADKKSIIAWHRSSPKKNRAKQEFPWCKKWPAWWAWTAWLRNQSGNTKICVIFKISGQHIGSQICLWNATGISKTLHVVFERTR